jgi:hypothetical protein
MPKIEKLELSNANRVLFHAHMTDVKVSTAAKPVWPTKWNFLKSRPNLAEIEVGWVCLSIVVATTTGLPSTINNIQI